MKTPAPAISNWELSHIKKIVSDLPSRKVFVEIGSRDGGSFDFFSRLMENGSLVVAIDLPGGPWGRKGSEENLKAVQLGLEKDQYDARIILGDSRSQGVKDSLKNILQDRPVDVLLIDADHAYESARADLEEYSPFVRPGGIIIMHDCGFSLGTAYKELPESVKTSEQVFRAFKEFSADRRSCIFQDNFGMGIIWVGEK